MIDCVPLAIPLTTDYRLTSATLISVAVVVSSHNSSDTGRVPRALFAHFAAVRQSVATVCDSDARRSILHAHSVTTSIVSVCPLVCCVCVCLVVISR